MLATSHTTFRCNRVSVIVVEATVVLLAQVRGQAERVAAVYDRDRRARHSFPAWEQPQLFSEELRAALSTRR
jgi:hypothetical protein